MDGIVTFLPSHTYAHPIFILNIAVKEKENDSCLIVEPNKGSFGESNFRLSDGIDQSDGLTTEDETHANTEYRSLAHFTRAPPGNEENCMIHIV